MNHTHTQKPTTTKLPKIMMDTESTNTPSTNRPLPTTTASHPPPNNDNNDDETNTQQQQFNCNNPMQNEMIVIRKAGRQAVRFFLAQHPCFNVLRTSGKVVVFDIRIPIQLAFYALVEHGTFFGRWF